MDGNELSQCVGGLQAHATVRVLQGFGEGGLQLGQEGLQGNPDLLERSPSQSLAEGECGPQGTPNPRGSTLRPGVVAPQDGGPSTEGPLSLLFCFQLPAG